jgi:hypothetical protein
MRVVMCGALVLACVAAPAARRAGELRSPQLARQLTTLMAERKLQTIAARDPGAADRFVAAMAFPEVQLLVVAAKYPAPPLVMNQLAQKQFADVYAELQEAGVKDSKLFFQDMGADGIGPDGGNVDVMYERGVVRTLFDGDWKKAHLSKDAYDEKVSMADTQYTRLLEILIAALTVTPPASAAPPKPAAG